MLIEKKLIMEKIDKSKITKTKFVCIELLQNIIHHQSNHESIFPYFILGISEQEITIFSGNVVTKEDKEKLTSSLQEIRDLSIDKIKTLYMTALRENAFTPKGTAGVGLLDIALRSKNEISSAFEKISNDLYTLNLDVKIK
jgi:hypothetical protein